MKLYRGLTKDGKMVYGWFYRGIQGHTYILEPMIRLCMGNTEVIPETVGQQVGKQDKNKNEIYDGDILKDDTGDIGIVRFGKLPLDKSGDCVCTYEAFYVECKGQLGQAPSYECTEIGDWMEIIGNVRQNPELLEK